MKLFDNFEAVRFPEEDMIFITNREYLYYVYNSKYKRWQKYKNAGNDKITVKNYPDVSKEELISAMQGVFPKKETDFMRMCHVSELCIRDMLDLLKEDYPRYMSDYSVYRVIRHFLGESAVCYKSYGEIRKLLDRASKNRYNHSKVISQLKEISFRIIGRNIYGRKIDIIDGHDGGSCFWIMPVRVIDYSNTNAYDNVAEMRSLEISIEEDDVYRYLTPFLYKHFDYFLEANKKRVDYYGEDEEGNEQMVSVEGFEWYLTHNFFDFESIKDIIKDMKDTIDALLSGQETEFTVDLREKDKEIETEMLIDFYHRFIYRMEYMMKVGKENGYDLISVMGP